MKLVIDTKSALLGLLAGIVTMLAIGAATSSSDTGRYQVAAGSSGFSIMVDTRTGQAWSFQPANINQWKTDENFWREK